MDNIDELYERISDLREKLYWREDVEEAVRDLLLHSSISIEDCERVFFFLNLPKNEQEYEPIYRKNEERLLKGLEVI